MPGEKAPEKTEITHSPERQQELDPLSRNGQNSTRDLGTNDPNDPPPVSRRRQLRDLEMARAELADLGRRLERKKAELLGETGSDRERKRERRHERDRGR